MSAESKTNGLATATLGGGCFWCIEAVFQRMEGVEQVVSGYAGGKNANPTYREVCTGQTGHAEVIQIRYDPAVVSFGDLLQVFFSIHDPTQLNRQGADVGTQYRSVVFYHDDEQKRIAEEYIQQLNASGEFADPIVTELSPAPTFYPAEDYHQDYFNSNPGNPYCLFVARPKIQKFLEKFPQKARAGA